MMARQNFKLLLLLFLTNNEKNYCEKKYLNNNIESKNKEILNLENCTLVKK
ncbi:hypothetical protein NBO_24g0032 [Nosema bombycis CQ1]|uniref:Uncharacterized protein n=1 Tax=Nosema bombycis (strain CQ1 / CVCC 102059) TaxID=578461 RepID=R0KWJ0_NOSB1|nr:hypothetical protein NBO_24g0032 [Nosema bombycis CQ1]|eukprot:EOB14587.1 hypothetical protein NBO_24g0032 [Nosema bombycis CQ1]